MAGTMIRCSVVIPAAGRGSRMNLGYNKMLHQIEGDTVLNHTIAKFAKFTEFTEIIIVINQSEELEILKSLPNDQRIKIAYGYGERQDSVAQGVKLATEEYVMVHDGARMYISEELINRTLKSLSSNQDAYVCAVKVKDSIRKVKNNKIVEVLNREELFAMQTPQIAKTKILKKIHNLAQNDQVNETDEVGLLNHYGYEVEIIEGDYSNIKITTIEDIT